MKLNAQQMVDRLRRRLGEDAAAQQGVSWSDQSLLDYLEQAHAELVAAAIDAGRDYFLTRVAQDLVADQDTYPLLDGFLRLRLLQRESSSDVEPVQYLSSPKYEGLGPNLQNVVPENAGGYTIAGDNIELENPPVTTLTGAFVQRVILEPPPPLLDLVASATASTVVLASSAPQEDALLAGTLIDIVSGTGSGQRRLIASYVGSTRTATLTVASATVPYSGNWTTIPVSTSKYATVSRLPRNFHHLLVTKALILARQDRDEDATAHIVEWNAGFEDFLAFVEERTIGQPAVPVFDPYDGL